MVPRAALALTYILSFPLVAATGAPKVCVLANTIPTADLVAGTSTHPAPRLLLEGLRERGWQAGKNVELVWRSAENDYTRMPRLSRELVEAGCAVIVVYGPGLDYVMRATSRVPIVMATSGVSGQLTDQGVVRVDSLARPGGNITGSSISGGADMNGKRLELLKMVAPHIRRVAILGHNEFHAASHIGPRTRKAAQTLGIDLVTSSFGSSLEKLEPAFSEMARNRVDAVIVTEIPATNLAPVQAEIHRLGERHRMAVMHEVLGAVDSGGLIAYGSDITNLYRRSAHYVDRILRGTNPAIIPIETPTDFELRVNLKAAKAIGLVLPQSLLVQAARVIE
jgi:putative tryptophan/tyrosine transport system substrate-binding protein